MAKTAKKHLIIPALAHLLNWCRTKAGYTSIHLNKMVLLLVQQQ
jgi:hypothetical protein